MSANEKPDGLEAELARRAREIESRVDAINLAAQPAPNCLAPMTPEQRAAFKSLTGAEIDAALSEGKRNADAVRAASGGLPGAFSAPSPAQAGPAIGTKARLRCPWRECRHEWDGEIGLHVYCPKCRCSLTINGPEVVSAPAQAGEAVAWGVRRVRTGIIVAAEITKDAAVERASDLTRTLQEEFSTDGHGIPLYAAPSRPGGAA